MRVLRERVDRYTLVGLTAMWILLWGELSALVVVGGLVLAVLLCLVYPMPKLEVPMTVRPVALVVLLLTFVRDLVVASVQIALLAVRPGRIGGGSLVEVALRSREQFFVTTTAGMTTLVPGSVVLDIDRDTGTLLLHCLHVFTPEEQARFRDRVLAQEERLLRALDKHADTSLSASAGRPMHGAGPVRTREPHPTQEEDQ